MTKKLSYRSRQKESGLPFYKKISVKVGGNQSSKGGGCCSSGSTIGA